MMTSREEVLTLVQDAMADLFELDKSKVVPEAHLYEDLDIDSIDAIDLIVHLKKVTGKRPDIETFKQVRTIHDMVEAIYVHINASSND
jgi:acyl carrier protein